jgi:hypothetical protein
LRSVGAPCTRAGRASQSVAGAGLVTVGVGVGVASSAIALPGRTKPVRVRAARVAVVAVRRTRIVVLLRSSTGRRPDPTDGGRASYDDLQVFVRVP